MLLKKSLTYQKGITLVELVIAFTLLGLIAAAGTAIDFTSRMALSRGKKRVDVRGRASFAMEHMARHIRFANKASVSGGGATIEIRLDYEDCDIQTVSALNTADDFTDDYEAKYEYKVASKELRYAYIAPGETWDDMDWDDMDVIATDVNPCNFTITNNPPKVEISIKVKKSGVEEVSLDTTVTLWCKGGS